MNHSQRYRPSWETYPRFQDTMPANTAGRGNFQNLVGNVTGFFKSKANKICAGTCDGFMLRMHYKYTFYLLLAIFFTVWYSWYSTDVISCVSRFNADAQVRLDCLNICLSYPFVEDPVSKTRRYLLFYRWIPLSLFVLAVVYNIPRKVSKNFDNARCKKLLEDLATNAHRYGQGERELVERAARYVMFNIKTHNDLYWKFVSVNALSLAIDAFAFVFLDFVLQGRFIQYGFNAYPLTRDSQRFTDYMSQTFPPFTLCELTPHNQVINKRNERFGCHLTIMELYEKVLLGLWLWLIFVAFCTFCYIVFLFSMFLPWVTNYLLRPAKPAHATESEVRTMIKGVSKNCKIGDIYLLYRLKGHLSHARFYELISKLSDPNLSNKQTQQPGMESVPEKENYLLLDSQEDNTLRQKRLNIPQDPPVNPEYLHQLITNPEIVNTHLLYNIQTNKLQ